MKLQSVCRDLLLVILSLPGVPLYLLLSEEVLLLLVGLLRVRRARVADLVGQRVELVDAAGIVVQGVLQETLLDRLPLLLLRSSDVQVWP